MIRVIREEGLSTHHFIFGSEVFDKKLTERNIKNLSVYQQYKPVFRPHF